MSAPGEEEVAAEETTGDIVENEEASDEALPKAGVSIFFSEIRSTSL